MSRIRIPRHWGVDEAIDVTDFLSDVIEAIWEVHGDRMAQRMRLIYAENDARELQGTMDEHDPYDEIPF